MKIIKSFLLVLITKSGCVNETRVDCNYKKDVNVSV